MEMKPRECRSKVPANALERSLRMAMERGHLAVADRQHLVQALGGQARPGVGQVGAEEATEAVDLVADLTVVLVPDAATAHPLFAQLRERRRGVVEVDEGRLPDEGGEQATHEQFALDDVHGARG